MPAHKLIEANRAATELLLNGLTVEGLPGWDGDRGQTIQFIDWAHPERNVFTVVSQYRVDCLPGFRRGAAFIVPDLVLLVNGIPLGVVEDHEGSEPLFHTNQLLIATSFDEASVGSIGAGLHHYAAWKTVAGPDGQGSEAAVAESLGKATLSEQKRLVAGLLRPAHLLDVVRHFTLFMHTDGQAIKTVCRYQQLRAVNSALHRLRPGATRAQDEEHDRRGSIVWHTQGIAVGTPIAEHPPHRSVRARFGHTAPTSGV